MSDLVTQIQKILKDNTTLKMFSYALLTVIVILSYTIFVMYQAYMNKKPEVIYITPEGEPRVVANNDKAVFNPNELKYIANSFTLNLFNWNNDTVYTNINNALVKFCTPKGKQAVSEYLESNKIKTLVDNNNIESSIKIKDINIINDKKAPYEVEITYTHIMTISAIRTEENKKIYIQLIPIERNINSIIGYSINNIIIKDDK